MELLRGEELGAKLKSGGALPVQESLTYLAQAARALDKTHAAGIVHRDLKPENLFLTTRDDGSGCLKILDFGVAKVLTEGTGKTTKALGTPLYMPLEQIQGSRDIGPEADRYALAHIAYAMIVGEPYWREESRDVGLVALCMKVANGIDEAATSRARRRCKTELPPAFDDWFTKAVATSPVDRYPSSVEMVADLERALVGREVLQGPASRGDRINTPRTLTALASSSKQAQAATPDDGPSSLSTPRGRLPLRWAVIAIPVIAASGAAAYFARQSAAPEPVVLPARSEEAAQTFASPTSPAASSEPATVEPTPVSSAPAASSLSPSKSATPSSSATSTPAARAAAKSPVPRPSATGSAYTKWSIY
jgi:serine/threonine-protein kinase